MQLVEIEFRSRRRVIYGNPEEYPLSHNDAVIVQADRGIDIGYVNLVNERFEEYNKNSLEDGQEPETVIRLAKPEDFERFNENSDHETEARVFFKQEITRLELVMKLVEVECQLDRRKLTFYFIADGRVDFRELVKSLAQKFHTRIDLRQIGARDESKRLGGIGICGRELCCPAWIREFKPVTTSMMKDQHMILNPQKNTGPCSKLRCCLRFEVDQYRELNQMLPKLGTQVKGPRGNGRVNKFSYNLEQVGIEWIDGTKFSYGMDHLSKYSDWKKEDNEKINLITFKTDPSMETQRKQEREGELVAREDPRPGRNSKASERPKSKKKDSKRREKTSQPRAKSSTTKAINSAGHSEIVLMEQVSSGSSGESGDRDSAADGQKSKRSGSKRRGSSKKSGGAKPANQQNLSQVNAETATGNARDHAQGKQDTKNAGEKADRNKNRRRGSRGRNRGHAETKPGEKQPRDDHSGNDSTPINDERTRPGKNTGGDSSQNHSSQPKDTKPVGKPTRSRGRNRKR